jgi:hypothetical protein
MEMKAEEKTEHTNEASLDAIGFRSDKKCSRFQFAKGDEEHQTPQVTPSGEAPGGTVNRFMSRSSALRSRAEMLAFYSANAPDGEQLTSWPPKKEAVEAEIWLPADQPSDALRTLQGDSSLLPKAFVPTITTPPLPPLNYTLRPFSEHHLTKNPSDRMWWYIDEARQFQGPFSGEEMDYWYQKGFFKPELYLGASTDPTKLITLREHVNAFQMHLNQVMRPMSKVKTICCLP